MSTSLNLSKYIDVRSFYENHGMVIVGKPTNSREGKEWHGSCVRCGGDDRFTVWESGRFSCSLRSSGCGIHGSSPYWFLRDVEGLSHRQACEELDIDPDNLPNAATTPALPLFMTRDEEPCLKWQTAAEVFLHRAEKYLWNKAPSQLDYLHSRGFTDATIREAHIGYCPGWYVDDLKNWGLTPGQTYCPGWYSDSLENCFQSPQDGASFDETSSQASSSIIAQQQNEIKIPSGLVIPWLVSSRIWKLSIRRPTQGYFQVLGSSDALYNIDSFDRSRPVFLFESELDALSAQQEAPDLASYLATGGASKAISARWIARLLEASQVYISFDQDANQAGDIGSQEWLKILPNAFRWTPWAKDCNQMLQQGLPIRLWIELPLQMDKTAEKMAHMIVDTFVETSQPTLFSQPLPSAPALIIPSLSPRRPTWLTGPTNERGLPLLCSICYRRKAVAYASECQPYCEKCWASR